MFIQNGKPNNYLESDEDLFKKHRDFTAGENKISLDRKNNEVKRQADAKADVKAKR